MPCARRKDRTLCEHKTLHDLLSNTMITAHPSCLCANYSLYTARLAQTRDHIWCISCIAVQLMFHCSPDNHATVALEMMAVTGPLEVMNGTPL